MHPFSLTTSDYSEIRSTRGRLFWAPSEATPNLFRSPICRLNILPIARVSTTSISNKPSTRSRHLSNIRKLANSRENAKRFLRFVTSSQPAPDIAGSSANARGPTISNLQGSQQWYSQTQGENMTRESRRNDHSRDPVISAPMDGRLHRPSLVADGRTASERSTGSTGSYERRVNTSNVVADEKPIASGNGVSISIALAEPVLFLQGFDSSELANRTTAMLRGSLYLRVSKSAKIKNISLNFNGRAETEWPEGRTPFIVIYLHCCRLTTHQRNSTKESRLQRPRGHNEPYVAFFQCPVP